MAVLEVEEVEEEEEEEEDKGTSNDNGTTEVNTDEDPEVHEQQGVQELHPAAKISSVAEANTAIEDMATATTLAMLNVTEEGGEEDTAAGAVTDTTTTAEDDDVETEADATVVSLDANTEVIPSNDTIFNDSDKEVRGQLQAHSLQQEKDEVDLDRIVEREKKLRVLVKRKQAELISQSEANNQLQRRIRQLQTQWTEAQEQIQTAKELQYAHKHPIILFRASYRRRDSKASVIEDL